MWRWWLPVALIALVLTYLFRDPFAGDWDALDYTVLALRGEPSSMLFGRMLFIFQNHALWLIAHTLFNLSPEKAYLLFKYAVIAQSPLASIAMWALAREVSNSKRTATLAALMLALSPFFVVYGGQAMTEIPSLLWLASALTIHICGLRRRNLWLVFAGAALLGLSVNIREAGAFYGLWLAFGPFVCGWKLQKNDLLKMMLACALFFTCALAPFATWWLLDLNNYRWSWHGWVESMRAEEALHPVSLRNFAPLFFFFFIAAPLALLSLPFAAWQEWRVRCRSPLLVMALIGLFANLVLVGNYSTAVNGRYLLTGLPGLLPLTANFLLGKVTKLTGNARRAFRFNIILIIIVALGIGGTAYYFSWPTLKAHGLTKDYRARLALLPRNAIVISGAGTVSVTFWRGVGVGEWEVIGTGGGWPGASQLTKVIDEDLRAGRQVFLDTDTHVWAARGWQLQETRAIVALNTRYHFRRVANTTIYELRPLADETARDAPDLQQLLPENRPPEETRRFIDMIESEQ